MWNDIEDSLGSHNPSRRRDGWFRLHRECMENHFVPSAEQIAQLHRARWQEEDDDVWRAAVNVMLEIPASDRGEEGSSLGNWLWAPFKEPSLVLRVSDPRSRRRDEDAVIMLARHLSRRDFPHAEFLRIPLDKPSWGQVLEERPFRAITIVGRLGLYGEHALKSWSRKDAHFRFITEHRPTELPLGQVDARYHCICERVPGSEPERSSLDYATSEQNGQRTDYGLVQRYVVTYKAKKVVVVVCAGASSLGTSAAVQWAADKLVGHGFGEDVIPLPERVGPDSTLEALVEVTADVSPYPSSWQFSDLKLVKLYVNDSVWSEDDHEWHRRSPKEITLVPSPHEPGKVSAVLFDGERTGLHGTSMMFRLLVEVCKLARETPSGSVDMARLVSKDSIWDGAEVTQKQVRQKLHALKRQYLADALLLDGTIVLRARVQERANPG